MRGNADFLVVPLASVWKEYQQAAVAQQSKTFPPVPPPAGVGVRTDKDDFACGVCLYPSHFGIVIAEFLITNPEIPMWERHFAVVECAKAIGHYAAGAGLDLWMPIRLDGIKRAVERAGFKSRGTEVYGVGR
jgi:hypothetical protein